MNASIKGALDNLNKSYTAFEHNGKQMTKKQVKNVLLFGIKQGYETTDQLSNEDVDLVLDSIK